MSILSAILLIVNIWAILSVFRSNAETIPKVIWSILILTLPIYGLLIWYLLGPKGPKG